MHYDKTYSAPAHDSDRRRGRSSIATAARRCDSDGLAPIGKAVAMSFVVETRTVADRSTAVGSAGPYTLVVDRPAAAGGGGLGFNGGQLLYLAVAGCVSNDLYREADAVGIRLDRVVVHVSGDFAGDPAVSAPITYRVEVSGDASEERLHELVAHVDRIAEIPNSLRRGTDVRLESADVSATGTA
jgi:uncharacterized OsmC-like protein